MGPHQTEKLLHSKGNPKENKKTKETQKKTKRQLTEWEKIVSNDATNKGLISRIYKNLYNLTAKKLINQWKNGQKT